MERNRRIGWHRGGAESEFMARSKRSMARADTVPERTVDKEMSDLGHVRKVRFGLASKFTTPVALVLSGAIVIMGFVVYGKTSESLQHQLTAQGIFAARIAAAPEIDSWDEDYNTYQNLSDRIGRIAAELALEGGASESSNTELTPQRVKEIRAAIKAHDESQIKYNKRRLAQIIKTAGGPGIYLDLWILNKEGKAKVTANSNFQFKRTMRITVPASPESEINTGTYSTPTGGTHPARFFFHPVKNKDGEGVGKAVVVFSESQIQADLDDLKGSIIIFCILGVVGTAAVAFGTAKIITRPLGHLMRDIKAVADGDLEHDTKVRSNDELGSLAHAFNGMTRNLAAAEKMRVDLADKEHQVSLAHEVQERLFPQTLPSPDGMTLDAHNRLAGDLSADYFDAVELADGRLAVIVMTASGRGVPAAIVLSMARSLFRSSGVHQDGPADALRAINRLLSPDLRRGMYVSALYAIINPASGEGLLASAGHRVPALHYVAESGGLKKLQADGIAIGLDKGPVFDRSLTETAFTLGSGDRLVLATEGASLLQDAEGNALGETAFMRVLLAGCKKNASVEAILSALETKLGAQPGDHDVTVVSAMRS